MLLVQLILSGVLIYNGYYLAAFVVFSFLFQLNAIIELREEVGHLQRAVDETLTTGRTPND